MLIFNNILRKLFSNFFCSNIIEQMDAKSCEKVAKKYSCESCDYNTSRKSSINKHLLSAKHLNRTKLTVLEQKSCPETSYKCKKCNKEYKVRNSLWYHEKKCNYEKEMNLPVFDQTTISQLVIDLIKSNQDLQKQMLDVCKIGNNTVISNNNNKTFNLQFFLNETCKDAMNIMDFVNSMTLEFSDLEDVGKLGYVEGISNIIIRKLNALDIHKRPIHCSDAKREIMYVKDENIWEKENSTYDKLRKAIKHITYKNSAMLVPWSQKYPACMNNQHHLNDVYVQMMGQAMGGRESFLDSENKIMKKIAKAVFINKE
jgi:hypothetical protein